MKRIAGSLIVAVFLSVSFPGFALASRDSHVIGRITGTYQPLPGYFHNNPYMLARGIDKVEFTGFRLTNADSRKVFLIRPNNDGFFHQALPGGDYILTRKRTDRPGYREPKTIDILNFTVDEGTIVNIGTIGIVLDGEPDESLRSMQHSARGTYSYRYRYERITGDSAFDRPMNWFRNKKPDTAAGFGDSVRMEDGAPTDITDGSRVLLRFRVPPDDR